MYINQDEHIISRVICRTALVRFAGGIVNTIARFALNKTQGLNPDMLNVTYTNFASVVSAVQVIIIAGFFYMSYTRLMSLKNDAPKEEFTEMGKLQENISSNDVSSLSLYSIMQLLQLWAAIFVGIQIIYDITSRSYQGFIEQISLMLNPFDVDTVNAFVSLYNNTHGFKYIGMFIAISIGIFVTGVFLKDARLQIAAFAILGFFMMAFVILQMCTITVLDRTVGIVWTSVLFHLIQTFGMFVFSIYLAKKYKGL